MTKKVIRPIEPCRVIVIDDVEEEASILIRALSVRNIPVLYYKGRIRELPTTPVTGVRVVFLDMKLEGMEGQEPKTVASSLMNLLRTIISAANGPYLILAWTTHDDLFREFKRQLQDRGTDVPRPYLLINMKKNDCIIEKKLDYQKVSGRLSEKFSEFPIFTFFTNWERAVADSGSEVISFISRMVDVRDQEKWTEELNKILYQTAKAYSDKLLEKKKETVTKSAMKALNSLLKYYIEKRVHMSQEELLTVPEDRAISEETIAKINTRFHFREKTDAEVNAAPGNLYMFEDLASLQKFVGSSLKDDGKFFKDFFGDNEVPKNVAPCLLEVTPMCDYSCDKWRASILLVGLRVASNMMSRVKFDADYLYTSPLVSLDGILCKMVFDFHYAVTLGFDKLAERKPNYEVGFDLLSDIQGRYSSHMSRRGIPSVR